MAKPITNIAKSAPTEEEKREKTLETVIEDIAQNADSIRQTIKLLQELHDSGILGALNAIIEAREEVAKILMGQMVRPPVTNMINNAMAVAGALTEIDPDMTKKLMGSVTKGLQKAEEGLRSNEKVGLFELIKALRDPDINRAIGFGLNFLKGIGEGLKE
jgi:uncharacterized protein YjgD (DUF1641 family)